MVTTTQKKQKKFEKPTFPTPKSFSKKTLVQENDSVHSKRYAKPRSFQPPIYLDEVEKEILQEIYQLLDDLEAIIREIDEDFDG